MSDNPSGSFYFCKNANMKATSISTNSEILLGDEELNRLVKFFDVLIEMDFEAKSNEKGIDKQ